MFHGQEVVKRYMWACVITGVTLYVDMIGDWVAPSIVAWADRGYWRRGKVGCTCIAACLCANLHQREAVYTLPSCALVQLCHHALHVVQ